MIQELEKSNVQTVSYRFVQIRTEKETKRCCVRGVSYQFARKWGWKLARKSRKKYNKVTQIETKENLFVITRNQIQEVHDEQRLL